MAIEDFAECYANRVETTVDAVIDDLKKLGVDGIRRFLSWFRSLDDTGQKLFFAMATSIAIPVFLGALKLIFTRTVGPVAAAALIGLLGGASWALLVRSFIECEDRL
jgi:hypothetical protein